MAALALSLSGNGNGGAILKPCVRKRKWWRCFQAMLPETEMVALFQAVLTGNGNRKDGVSLTETGNLSLVPSILELNPGS